MNILFMVLMSLSFQTAQAETKLEDSYQPETYTKYDISLEKEKLNISVFKIIKGEPHLNPVYFDVYFQCGETKSYYKLKREFGAYENELTYCGNEKPVVQKMDGKSYLNLPLRLAEPELGCPEKINKKESFSIEEIVQYCEKAAAL